MQYPIKEAPNYTNAFLVMAFVNLLAWFILIWSAFGYGAALLAGFGLHLLVRRLDRLRS